MTVDSLARDVLELLRLQRAYFDTRDHAKLVECRVFEQRLKADCDAIVNPKPQRPTLFDQIEENG